MRHELEEGSLLISRAIRRTVPPFFLYQVAFKNRSSQGREIDVEEYDEETTKICT